MDRLVELLKKHPDIRISFEFIEPDYLRIQATIVSGIGAVLGNTIICRDSTDAMINNYIERAVMKVIKDLEDANYSL